jgi:hypothetical protein
VLAAPIVREHGGRLVVRDDLLRGGTKMRAIMPLIESSDASEFVYASPAQGYAQVALALCALAAGRRATVFTAKRSTPHPLTMQAKAAGAKIVMVPHGYLNVVKARARDYAAKVGAYLIPFGVEDARSIEAIAAAARSLPVAPAEVWSVTGSGVLTRALQRAWPQASFVAVIVGKKDSDTGRARQIIYPAPFEADAKSAAPFPSARNYDAKGWEIFARQAPQGALFWNVSG